MSTEYAYCPKINEELQLSQNSFYVVVNLFIIRDVLNFPSTAVIYLSQTGAKATCAG
jgi:hypothetical protein